MSVCGTATIHHQIHPTVSQEAVGFFFGRSVKHTLLATLLLFGVLTPNCLTTSKPCMPKPGVGWVSSLTRLRRCPLQPTPKNWTIACCPGLTCPIRKSATVTKTAPCLSHPEQQHPPTAERRPTHVPEFNLSTTKQQPILITGTPDKFTLPLSTGSTSLTAMTATGFLTPMAIRATC